MSEPMHAIVDVRCQDGDTTFVVAGYGTLSECRRWVQTITGQRMATDSYQAGRDQFLQALDMWSMRLSDGLGWDAMTYATLGWPMDFSWMEGPEPEDPAELPEVTSILAILAVPAYPTRP